MLPLSEAAKSLVEWGKGTGKGKSAYHDRLDGRQKRRKTCNLGLYESRHSDKLIRVEFH